MPKRIIDFYKTGPDRVPIEEPGLIRRLYESSRWSVFLSTTLGYGVFYTCRLSLSVAKKPMLEAGVLDVAQMGKVGFVLLFVYAFGKFINGFLSDRSNIRRFISSALLASAVVNLLFGFNNTFWAFLILWGLNGWFQSIGSAPCVVSLCQLFSNRERGSYYGLWAASHSIGEGITFVGTAALVAVLGWRWGFIGPGLLALGVALILFKTLRDRPQTYGLPHVSEYKEDDSAGPPMKGSVGALQLEVIKSPVIWILGLSSASMYMARYAMNNWGIFYLQEAKGYGLVEAGGILAFYPILGLFGASLCGIISDRLFSSRRNIPTLLYGLLLIGSMSLFFYGPSGQRWLDILSVSLFGFAIGGLIVFLAGLTVLDAFSKRAAGAVKGILGLFSYLGAAAQDWISGSLIQAGHFVDAQGKDHYDFSVPIQFWMGAATLSLILALTVWNVKAKE